MGKAVTIKTDKSGKQTIIAGGNTPASEQVKKLAQYRKEGLPKGAELIEVVSLGSPVARLSQSKIDAQKKHDEAYAKKYAKKVEAKEEAK